MTAFCDRSALAYETNQPQRGQSEHDHHDEDSDESGSRIFLSSTRGTITQHTACNRKGVTLPADETFRTENRARPNRVGTVEPVGTELDRSVDAVEPCGDAGNRAALSAGSHGTVGFEDRPCGAAGGSREVVCA